MSFRLFGSTSSLIIAVNPSREVEAERRGQGKGIPGKCAEFLTIRLLWFYVPLTLRGCRVSFAWRPSDTSAGLVHSPSNIPCAAAMLSMNMALTITYYCSDHRAGGWPTCDGEGDFSLLQLFRKTLFSRKKFIGSWQLNIYPLSQKGCVVSFRGAGDG